MLSITSWFLPYENSQETFFSGLIIIKSYFSLPYLKDTMILVSHLAYLFASSIGRLRDKILTCLAAVQNQLAQIWVCYSDSQLCSDSFVFYVSLQGASKNPFQK